MYDPINPWFYHLWSSALVGLLAWALMSLISTRRSSAGQAGSTNWTYWSQLRLPLVLAAWTHIVADVIEHGNPPRVISGVRGLVRFLVDLAPLVLI